MRRQTYWSICDDIFEEALRMHSAYLGKTCDELIDLAGKSSV
jgi:hypothetical protein